MSRCAPSARSLSRGKPGFPRVPPRWGPQGKRRRQSRRLSVLARDLDSRAMAASRLVVVVAVGGVAIAVGSSAAAPNLGGLVPRDWTTYGLVDVRNPGSPAALIESRHHRN